MHIERERVSRAMDALTRGLYPVVERELKAVYRDRWHDFARSSFRDDRNQRQPKGEVLRWDAHTLLMVMWDQWNKVFRDKFGMLERSLVSELREYRNRWAHQADFDFNDAYRILDSAERLLRAAGAPEAEIVAKEKRDHMRSHFSREAKAVFAKAQVRRRTIQDLLVYGACCLSIVAVILQLFGWHAWFFATFVVFVFGYLAWQRLQTPPPVFFGPHECPVCQKIIYGDDCPYCESPRRKATLAKQAAESGDPADDPPADDAAAVEAPLEVAAV